ncbi:outer membrane lipoprotein-sorting protein [Undibacterium sp. FT147W]|uniref:Outer membrane lipoprotein-sorting protein n=1 Tax=Undibacterium rivi TaxID=2828729 RepID=A0ABS5H607_9BURK|nr:outer membrane lipoprotein-sorting protein [Undibacterium rivi]MBR7793960.1 outer membrane lipoprotein-sorting protein [Undibacterium rivi]
MKKNSYPRCASLLSLSCILSLTTLQASAESPAHAAAPSADISQMIKATDQLRVGGGNMQVETEITTFQRDGSVEKERKYRVYSQAQRQSLVLMQSPAEKGQKVLMSGDDFWMLLPGSQRPMRITPMQKLLGDASVGDIATMNWAEDYQATLVAEEKCDDKVCLHVRLNASRKSLAYQRIELWIGKKFYEPLKADLYVQSEKLAKQARFVMDKAQAPTAVVEMLLADQISNHKETRIRYLHRQPKTVPEQWLNPMFLAKNPVLE